MKVLLMGATGLPARITENNHIMDSDNASEILVTGGTGLLGKRLQHLLERNQISFAVSTHQTVALQGRMVFMDLTAGDGIGEALKNRRLIVHLASDKKKPDNDIIGMRNLLNQLKKLGQNTHIIYVSITGTDQLHLPYFKQKWQAEQILMGSAQPYTIFRATQFHDYIDFLLRQFLRWPVGILPRKTLIQPIDVDTAAAALYHVMQTLPLNETVEIGGPQILPFGEAAGIWLDYQHKKKFIINLPVWGSAGRKLQTGALTSQHPQAGSISWADWLKNKFN